VRFEQFAAACPELAALGEERLRRNELCLLGTIRADGSPRISPCEPDFAAGHLGPGARPPALGHSCRLTGARLLSEGC
jgi:hypothetical protein